MEWPKKIFLSHAGVDKPLVREFKETLTILGFDPWLDEDAMPAGGPLERSILKGFEDSCAAVFFITPSFLDENYLATEVDYAIAEKRKKGDRFVIITLVLEAERGQRGQVPGLLKRYVWKEPKSHLEALREIIRALPIKLGEPGLETDIALQLTRALRFASLTQMLRTSQSPQPLSEIRGQRIFVVR